MSAILGYAKETLNLSLLYAEAFATNTKAIHLYQKISGFFKAKKKRLTTNTLSVWSALMKIGHFDLNTSKTLIIAELSANHGHSLEIAKKSIRAAKTCWSRCDQASNLRQIRLR